jgi:hypothetical protein
MNALQPFAQHVPYMAAVGNHECGGSNLAHYAMRFAAALDAEVILTPPCIFFSDSPYRVYRVAPE